ncbi:MAG: phosphodiesterase [Rhodospirillaceae bacterium]|jgi:3',5'-cyclic-AMP phosphodiesterase|nr:phosphodiesterase [Rhodospirillaceae bacterium]
MLIAHLSDTHLMTPDTADDNQPAAQARVENLSAAVARVNALSPAVDAVIFTGDMAQHRAPEEYALAREILSALTAPLYVIPGNRDCRATLRRNFAADGYMSGEGDAPILYAIDDYPVRLIGFDSQSGFERKGDVDAAKMQWLDATLAQAPNTPSAVLMHHPPIPVYTSDYPWQWQREEAGNELASLFAAHPQVTRIFSGHSHRAYQDKLGDILVSTVPSIAVDLRLGDFEPQAETHPIFQVHRFDSDNGFTSETIIADNAAINNAA